MVSHMPSAGKKKKRRGGWHNPTDPPSGRFTFRPPPELHLLIQSRAAANGKTINKYLIDLCRKDVGL